MVFLQKSYEIELRELDVNTQNGNFYLAASIGVEGDKLGAIPNPEVFQSALKGRAYLRVAEGLAKRISREISMMQLKALSPVTLRKEELAALNATADQMGSQQIQMLVDQKFLVAKNGDYRMTLSYQQGELVLNNQPIAFPPQTQ